MLLGMVGSFGILQNVKTYADDKNVIDFPKSSESVLVNSEKDVTYRIVPDKTGVYAVFWSDMVSQCGLYNSDMEFIGNIINDHYAYQGDDGNFFYLCSGKTYYVNIRKKTSNVINSHLRIVFDGTIDLKKASDVSVYIGSAKTPINSANMKGLSYDEKTHILEINNYTGSDEIRIVSPWYFEADEKDAPNFPNINIKISGVNNVAYNTNPKIFLGFEGHGNFNIVGDGTLNVKFSREEIFVSGANTVIAGRESNIIFDGPTINVEETDSAVITTCYITEGVGKLTIKSGSINIYSFIDFVSFYTSAIDAGAFEMTGGRIYVNYTRSDSTMEGDVSPAIYSNGEVSVTGGIIILTGYKKTLDEVEAIGSIANIKDGIKVTVLKGSSFDISKLNVKLEKDVYEYDGKAKTPKVNVEDLIEGTDFAVSYENNVKVGTAKVTIKGLGLFTGSKVVTFKIVEGKDDKGSIDGINGPKVGSKITDGKLIYKVTKAGTLDGKKVGKVTVVGLKTKSLKKVSIKSVIKVNGVKYKVTAIGKKAFEKGKKLKKITIKSKYIKAFAKGAFKGLKKACVIKVPKAKKRAYTKKIKKAGFKGKIK